MRQSSKQLKDVNDIEPPQFFFYPQDVRQPKEQRLKKNQESVVLRGLNGDSQDSLDIRDRIMGGLGQRRVARPASNQIDRFGRIAFNKNRELSQASLDVDKEE